MSKPRVPVATEQEAREALGIPEQVKDYREAGLGKKFAAKVLARNELLQTVKEITNDKKTGTLDILNAEIGNMLVEAGEKSVNFEGRLVTLCEGTNVNLSKEKLLEMGVPASTILAATIKKSYNYISVSKEKEKANVE